MTTLPQEERQLRACVDLKHLAAACQVIHQPIRQGLGFAQHDLAQLSLCERPLRRWRLDC